MSSRSGSITSLTLGAIFLGCAFLLGPLWSFIALVLGLPLFAVGAIGLVKSLLDL